MTLSLLRLFFQPMMGTFFVNSAIIVAVKFVVLYWFCSKIWPLKMPQALFPADAGIPGRHSPGLIVRKKGNIMLKIFDWIAIGFFLLVVVTFVIDVANLMQAFAGAVINHPVGAVQAVLEQVPNSVFVLMMGLGGRVAGAKTGAKLGALGGPAGAGAAIGALSGAVVVYVVSYHVPEGGYMALERVGEAAREGHLLNEQDYDNILKEIWGNLVLLLVIWVYWVYWIYTKWGERRKGRDVSPDVEV